MFFLDKQFLIMIDMTQENINETGLHYVLLLYCSLLKVKTKSAHQLCNIICIDLKIIYSIINLYLFKLYLKHCTLNVTTAVNVS